MEQLSTQESRILEQALSHRVRPDFREMLQPHELQAEFGQSTGVVVVSLGSTKVLGKVHASIAAPRSGRPNEGMLKFVVDVAFSNRSKDFEIEIQQALLKLFKGSKAFDNGSLVIIGGKAVWEIKVALTLLLDNGSVFQAMVYAAQLALKDYRKPFVEVQDGKPVIVPEKGSQPLSLTQILAPFSLGLLSGQRSIFMSPSLKESQVMAAEVRVVVNNYREVVLLSKEGRCDIHKDVLDRVAEICTGLAGAAVARVRELAGSRGAGGQGSGRDV